MHHELNDNEWRVIQPMLSNKPRGVPRVDDRTADGLSGLHRCSVVKHCQDCLRCCYDGMELIRRDLENYGSIQPSCARFTARHS